ncbi:MAG: hypothetical protein K9K65_07385 [Desulfarculaceae bacterium]|nr:hypothetical protein [Desulfarculaceae bacterium]MCF8049033.1 hypothetical protein [Desulfarculaceae bacterium]MCF8097649.1 hypothetical protein [Desulfarculaceae bacterium]MCF8122843.1 hypothetical protein [Desulfarculaceae bacterium]
MSPTEGPDIVLEFSGGVMTIRTQEAVYQVSVTALGEGARTLPPASQQALPGLERPAQEARRELPGGEASPALAPPAADYYSELCHDIYREVGLLARRVATSLDKPGNQGAKAPAMEELTQEMGRSLEKTRKLLAGLKKAAEQQRQNADDRSKLLSAVEKSTVGGQSPLAPLAKRAQELMTLVAKSRVQNGQAVGFRFGLDSIFQAVYDHCTNQTVRKHLQSMWDDPAAFDERQLEQLLNQAAPSEPPPGGVVRFQLPAVLSALEETTGNSRYGQILQKMQATVDQLFPDTNLYVEAEVLGSAAQPPDPALLEEVESFLARVQSVSRSAPSAPSEMGEIIQALLQDESQQQAARFQGLSDVERQLTQMDNLLAKGAGDPADQAGARRMGEALVQMLAILAGLKVKLTAKEKDPAVNAFQAEQKAQAQVERALKGLELPDEPGEPPSPDAKKVDRLLESLGF